MHSTTALPQLQAQLSGLRGLVADLGPEAIALPEATALWAAFDQIERAGAAAKTLLAARVEESGVWKQKGYPSAAHHLAAVAGSSVRSAQAVLATSKRLVDLPATAAALRCGQISGSQAQIIADAAVVNPDAETDLLDKAPRVSLGELVDAAGRAKAAGDPDPDKTYARIRRGRFLRQHRDSEGAWNLRTRGTVDAGAMVAIALEPIIDELFETARAQGERIPRETLAFDALVELALRAIEDDYDYIDNDEADDNEDAVGADPDEGNITGDRVTDDGGAGDSDVVDAATGNSATGSTTAWNDSDSRGAVDVPGAPVDQDETPSGASEGAIRPETDTVNRSGDGRSTAAGNAAGDCDTGSGPGTSDGHAAADQPPTGAGQPARGPHDATSGPPPPGSAGNASRSQQPDGDTTPADNHTPPASWIASATTTTSRRRSTAGRWWPAPANAPSSHPPTPATPTTPAPPTSPAKPASPAATRPLETRRATTRKEAPTLDPVSTRY
jgi:hypothetical protein